MYYFKQFNESQSKAIPQNGDENNGHEYYNLLCVHPLFQDLIRHRGHIQIQWKVYSANKIHLVDPSKTV